MRETIADIRAAVGVLTPGTRLALLAILGLVVVLCGLGMAQGLSSWRERRYEAQERKNEVERRNLAAERDHALRRAEAAESRGVLLEEQVAAQKRLLPAANARVQAADKKVEEAIRAKEEEIATAGAPAQSPDELRADIRRRLAELGY